MIGGRNMKQYRIVFYTQGQPRAYSGWINAGQSTLADIQRIVKGIKRYYSEYQIEWKEV